MKKLLTVALVGLAVSGIALAASLSVPFFNDMSANDGSGPGAKAFVGVKNTTDAPVEFTLTYYDPDGVNVTPTDHNTFILSAQRGIGFRPYANDPDDEGVGAEVPNMSPEGTTKYGRGSVLITWFGTGTELIGRVTEVWGNVDRNSYVMPGSWAAPIQPE